MNSIQVPRLKLGRFLIMAVLLAAIVLSGSMAFGHGSKGHAGGYTALQALNKGVQLYDSLCEKGKLSESWETDLESVEVSSRTSGGQKEFVVKFSRLSGEPKSVYIFLSEKGEYKGSNFTGE